MMTSEHRAALADSIRALSDSVIRSGERLDAEAMTARFLDGPAAAFGGAGGLVLSAEQLRNSLAQGYRGLVGQRFEIVEQRVAILGLDAASATGWGNVSATHETGARANSRVAFTFVWGRRGDEWRVIQAHFSSQLVEALGPAEEL